MYKCIIVISNMVLETIQEVGTHWVPTGYPGYPVGTVSLGHDFITSTDRANDK